MKNYSRRLERLIKENPTERPVYKIEYCTQERADELKAERPAWQPGDRPRYIIVPPEHMPMWFGPLDET
jgi:hypothetical protein